MTSLDSIYKAPAVFLPSDGPVCIRCGGPKDTPLLVEQGDALALCPNLFHDTQLISWSMLSASLHPEAA